MPKKAGRRARPHRSGSWTPRDVRPPNHSPDMPQVEADAPHADPWRRFVLLPLRLFLGVTFVYAGLQKATDTGFLAGGGDTYIGRQLEGFAPRSPLGPALAWLGRNAAIEVGVLVILVELAVGVAVLLGFRTRLAAAAGAALSFVLFLSASWDVQPYFLGSDSIYTVAWTTLALSGDEGVWAPARGRPRLRTGRSVAPAFDPERRRVLLQLGGAAVAAVWILGLLPRGRTEAGAVVASPHASATSTPAPQPSTTPAGASPTASPTGLPATAIGTQQQLRAQGSITYQDPKTGDPAVAIDLGNGNVVAYDAVCTHAGCTVEYDPSQKVLFCPCHGAAFDPSHDAAVLQGPAPDPLPALKVQLGSDGNIYAVD